MTTRGERLRAYLLTRTGGASGWQARLVEASGVKRQTISKWTNPEFDRYPDLEALAQVARALSVETWEIVAAMDGKEQVVDLLSPAAQEALTEIVDRALDARGVPRRRSPREGDAA
jgi:transcriptional regulator with XRE-family HTH domain